MASKKILIEIGVVDKNATKQIDQVNKSVSNLAKSAEKVQKTGKNKKATAGIDNAILMETSRLASDASFGFTAIANNLSQLINLFKVSKDATGSYVNSLRRLINVQSLALIGLQLLITFFPAIIKKFKELRAAADPLKDTFSDISSNISSTAGSFEVYIRTLQNGKSSQEAQKEAIMKLNEEFPDYVKLLNEAGVSLEDVKNKTQGAADVNEVYRKSLVRLAKARAASSKIEEEQGKLIQAEIDATQELAELGLTLEEGRELSAKRDEARFLASEKRGSAGRKLRKETETAEILAADKIIKALDEQNVRGQETINALAQYTDIELEFNKRRRKAAKEESEEKKKYSELEVQNFDKEIEIIKQLGRIRTFFHNANMDLLVEDQEFRGGAIEMERQQRLAEVDAITDDETKKLAARREINKYYDDLLIIEKKQALLDLGQAIVEAAGRQSAVGKATAIAMALFNTYEGITKALSLAPPLGEIYAVTRGLMGFAQVKNIMNIDPKNPKVPSSAGGVGRGGAVQAPDFNIVGASATNQLAQLVSGTKERPLRAFVVASDLTEVVDENNTNTETSKI